MLFRYTARIRHPRTGGIFNVIVEAPDMNTARMMIETQYGAENVATGVHAV